MQSTQIKPITIQELNPGSEDFFKMVTSWKFKLWMSKKLPMALIAGLSVDEMNAEVCKVSVPYKWLNQNPFNSTYFAVLSMAAELSTALPCSASFYNGDTKINMLVSKLESQFSKKAKDRITFVCSDLDKVIAAVQETKQTGEWAVAPLTTVGYNPQNEEVSRFNIEWSLRAKL